MVQTIAIYGSKRQHPYAGAIADFLDAMDVRGLTVYMHRKLYDHLTELVPEVFDRVDVRRVAGDGAPKVDLVLSLGGDGTFLRAAQWVGNSETPVLGVNTGHLGYLAAIGIEELNRLPEMLEQNCFRAERRCVLQVLSPALPPHVGNFALNEVSIAKEESASMINVSVHLDGDLLAHYKADGLVCATSTGSTAYNLSLGGPIVHPSVPVWILSPVAAHSLAIRPFVAAASCRVNMVPTGRSPHVRLAVDGRSVLIDSGSEICLARAPFDILVLRLDERSFAQTLRMKLRWADGN